MQLLADHRLPCLVRRPDREYGAVHHSGISRQGALVPAPVPAGQPQVEIPADTGRPIGPDHSADHTVPPGARRPECPVRVSDINPGVYPLRTRKHQHGVPPSIAAGPSRHDPGMAPCDPQYPWMCYRLYRLYRAEQLLAERAESVSLIKAGGTGIARHEGHRPEPDTAGAQELPGRIDEPGADPVAAGVPGNRQRFQHADRLPEIPGLR